jgi:hypothetical protein
LNSNLMSSSPLLAFGALSNGCGFFDTIARHALSVRTPSGRR